MHAGCGKRRQKKPRWNSNSLAILPNEMRRKMGATRICVRFLARIQMKIRLAHTLIDLLFSKIMQKYVKNGRIIEVSVSFFAISPELG